LNLQYYAIAPLLVTHWREQGEDSIANYFFEHLMTANFHITASFIPGTNPSNQPIESKHKREKQDFYGICIL
jgi:hypothetical protein